jgi:hypothetical protein
MQGVEGGNDAVQVAEDVVQAGMRGCRPGRRLSCWASSSVVVTKGRERGRGDLIDCCFLFFFDYVRRD